MCVCVLKGASKRQKCHLKNVISESLGYGPGKVSQFFKLDGKYVTQQNMVSPLWIVHEAKEQGLLLQGKLAGSHCCTALLYAVSRLTSKTLLPLCRLLRPHCKSMCSISAIPVLFRKEFFFFSGGKLWTKDFIKLPSIRLSKVSEEQTHLSSSERTAWLWGQAIAAWKEQYFCADL